MGNEIRLNKYIRIKKRGLSETKVHCGEQQTETDHDPENLQKKYAKTCHLQNKSANPCSMLFLFFTCNTLSI